MKISICATLTSILFLALADLTEATDKEKPHKKTDRAPLTLVILDSTDQATTDAAKELIEAAGGSIGLISTEQVMIGWVPETVHSSLKGEKTIREFFQEPVDPGTLNLASAEARTTVSTFNSMLAAQDLQCETCDPGSGGGNDWGPLQEGWISAETAQQEEARRRAVGTPNYTRYFSMQGNVGVALILIESAQGSQNLYTWDSAQVDAAKSRVDQGLVALSNRANQIGVSLTFETWLYSPILQPTIVTVPYEPVRLEIFQDHFWINPIMERLGQPQTASDPRVQAAGRVEAFNDAESSRRNKNHFLTIFMANNSIRTQVGAPGYGYADGYATSAGDATFRGGNFVGYVYSLGGPYVQMLFTNGFNGPGTPRSFNSIRNVAAHEVTHIFWACDEYEGSNTCTGCEPCTGGRGPRPTVANGNCVRCTTNQIPCFMWRPFEDYTLSLNRVVSCTHTGRQIGWQATPTQ